MTKLGLYDPTSLSEKDGVMQIAFINAVDAGDVVTVRLRNQEDVRRVVDTLIMQKSKVRCPVAPLDRTPLYLAGTIIIDRKTGHGMIAPGGESNSDDLLVFEPVFDLEPGTLPESGTAVISGFMEGDVLKVYHISIDPMTHTPQPGQAPRVAQAG